MTIRQTGRSQNWTTARPSTDKVYAPSPLIVGMFLDALVSAALSLRTIHSELLLQISITLTTHSIIVLNIQVWREQFCVAMQLRRNEEG